MLVTSFIPRFGASPTSGPVPSPWMAVSGADTVHFGTAKPVDPAEPPTWIYTRENPAVGKVVSVTPLGKSKDPATAYALKVVVDLAGTDFVKDGKLQLKPGHHLGLGFPGIRARWYSVASSTFGEGSPTRVALIVRRLEYDKDGKQHRGEVSNMLAKLKAGDSVTVAGPPINRFLLPDERSGNLLLFSVGVALAPYRAGLKARFEEQGGPAGETRLYTGYRTRDDELLPEELAQYAVKSENNFHYRSAFSREPGSSARYLADLIAQDADNVLRLLKDPKTRVYICGIIGMEDGIRDAIIQTAAARGEDGEALIKRLKDSGRWVAEGARRH